MDFSAIYQAVQPYFTTGAIGTVLVGFIGLFCKGIKAFKEMKNTFKDTNAEAINRLQKALPSSLTVSLESITKTELAKLKSEITESIKNEFVEPIKANTELMQVMAEALAQSKLTPDEYKERIAKLLELDTVETTNSLKVELTTTTETEKASEKKSEEILVD